MAKLIAGPLRFEICNSCRGRQYWGRRDLCPAWTFELTCPQAAAISPEPEEEAQPLAPVEPPRHHEELICRVCSKKQFEGAYICPDGEKCLRYPEDPDEPDIHICSGECLQRYSPNAPIEIRIDEFTRADMVEFIFDTRYNAHPALREVNAGLDDMQIHFLKEMIAQTVDAFLEFFNEDPEFMEWKAAKVAEWRKKQRERKERLNQID